MTSYRIEISASAEKQIRKLSRAQQVRVLRAIQTLAVEPRPRGVRKLHGYADVYRMRVGSFRILYSIEPGRLLVLVLKVGHRRDVYQGR